jgi:hypothetical protein
MATQDYAASIQGVSIRVTRLDAAGNLLNQPGDSYTTSAFMRISFTPEYEEGDEITEKAADGTVCVTYKSPDTLKRITMEVAICEPDPELTQMMSGGGRHQLSATTHRVLVSQSRHGRTQSRKARRQTHFLTSTGRSRTASFASLATA